jgi:DNA-binding response OmpR family regulator
LQPTRIGYSLAISCSTWPKTATGIRFDRRIDIRITRIRRKIELDPGKPQTIKTVRGAGYIFVPNPQ